MPDLVWFDQAHHALQQAVKIDEVKHVRDQAEALRLYAKQAGEGLEMQNWCAEIKIRAERRAGELLQEIDRARAGDNQWSSHDAMTTPPTLKELGIEPNQSSRYQAIASVPDEVFEEHIAQKKADGRELTSAGVLYVAKTLREEAVQQVSTTIDIDPTTGDIVEPPSLVLFPDVYPHELDQELHDGQIDESLEWDNWSASFNDRMDKLMVMFESMHAHGGFRQVMRLWPHEAKEVFWQDLRKFVDQLDEMLDLMAPFCVRSDDHAREL